MNKNFILTGLVTAVVNLILHAGTFFVNFGLFSAQNIFSLASVFADLACSTFAMTFAAAVAAWMLGKTK
jgi:hypothetical protein